MKWARQKSLSERIQHLQQTNDNLHRIAISNLQDHERRTIRWWCKKYRTPLKPLEEHTIEELVIEMLEDYYDEKPEEILRFQESLLVESGETLWDGRMSGEYEKQVGARLKKLNAKRGIDISKYQSEDELSNDEVQNILDNVGRDLPKSRALTKKGVVTPPSLGDGEFEDEF